PRTLSQAAQALNSHQDSIAPRSELRPQTNDIALCVDKYSRSRPLCRPSPEPEDPMPNQPRLEGDTLTAKQRRFVDALLAIGGNRTQAIITAGYGQKSAHATGCTLSPTILGPRDPARLH